MSELAGFAKQVDQFTLKWAEQSDRFNSLSNEDSQLPDVHAKASALLHNAKHELAPLGEKLLTKMSQTDPVTGQKRYGPASVTKLTTSKEKLDAAVAAAEPTFQQIDSMHRIWQEKQPATAPAPAAAEVSPQPQIILHEVDDKPVVETEEMIALRKEAELVRQRQQQERMRLHALAQQVAACLESVCHAMAELAYRSDEVDRLTDQLQKEAKAHNISAKETLGFVVGILERVIGRPDDQQARRLRLTHPTIWAKLGGRPGGIQLMAALGFVPQLHSTLSPEQQAAEDTDSSLRSREGLLLVSLPRITATLASMQAQLSAKSPESDLSSIVDLLSPHTSWEIVLEMHEPSFDDSGDALAVAYSGKGKQSWLQWFDGLKAHKELIQGYL